jgi:putative addiction module component (TIGR02574 family)
MAHRFDEVTVNAISHSIVDQALRLPEQERAQVVQALLNSLSPDAERQLDDAWASELDQRLAEFEKGESDAVSWSDLKDQQ